MNTELETEYIPDYMQNLLLRFIYLVGSDNINTANMSKVEGNKEVKDFIYFELQNKEINIGLFLRPETKEPAVFIDYILDNSRNTTTYPLEEGAEFLKFLLETKYDRLGDP